MRVSTEDNGDVWLYCEVGEKTPASVYVVVQGEQEGMYYSPYKEESIRQEHNKLVEALRTQVRNLEQGRIDLIDAQALAVDKLCETKDKLKRADKIIKKLTKLYMKN